ncbi:MAG: isoprenylcysteine carboxylmethyltransferase family protein [Deltaproteobacteria bacterium]|nr:isoprenylcysteine carboxylmethyltransferase family protein [Deltaproteobacteria bacterium]
MPSEVFIHAGLGLFFSIMIIEWSLGAFSYWERLDIFWLKIIGFILFIPSAYLEWTSHEMLKHKGNPEGGKLDATTVFLDSGIYRIVRQPMTFGLAIWSIALILVFQSFLSLILGIVCVLCFWLSAIKEGEHNISKFGEAYRQYMQKVPMWNVLNGLLKEWRIAKSRERERS